MKSRSTMKELLKFYVDRINLNCYLRISKFRIDGRN